MFRVWLWCLPTMTEKELNDLYDKVLEAVVSVPNTGLGKTNVVCLFPTDAMSKGLGNEIIVKMEGSPADPLLTMENRQGLAESVGKCVAKAFPNTQIVECSVVPIVPSQGFWTSTR